MCVQSLPIGKPKLVTPSLVKMDIEALRRDIPRYHQNMPKEAADVWEGWFSHLDELTCVPDSYCWPIDKLRQSARTAPAPPAAQISPDLLELRDRETRQIQEVSPQECIYRNFFSYLFFSFAITCDREWENVH